MKNAEQKKTLRSFRNNGEKSAAAIVVMNDSINWNELRYLMKKYSLLPPTDFFAISRRKDDNKIIWSIFSTIKFVPALDYIHHHCWSPTSSKWKKFSSRFSAVSIRTSRHDIDGSLEFSVKLLTKWNSKGDFEFDERPRRSFCDFSIRIRAEPIQ